MVKFPQEPGQYFWEDWGQFKISSVSVSKDAENHLKYLAELPLFKQSIWPGVKYAKPYVYQNEKGETLTMYWDGDGGDDPIYPPFLKDSVQPNVNGFIPFDFDKLMEGTLK